jgi:HEAT repeat protein
MPHAPTRPSPRRGLILAVVGVLAAALPLSALPHGGVYRGPGGTVPPGSAPGGAGPTSGGGGAASPGSAGVDPDSWATWWAYRRDPYLELKAAVHGDGTASRPRTPGAGFPLGRGEVVDGSGAWRPSEVAVRERIVPALREALRSADGVDLESACLLALAKIGVDPAGESLVELLQSHLDAAVQEVAESAALGLGLCGSERALALLADLLDDRESARARVGGAAVAMRTRAFSAYALGLGAARSRREDVRRFAVSRLAAALGRERYAARDVPVAIVQSLGLVPLAPPAERALQAWLAPHSPATAEQREGAIVGLQLLGDGDADELDREISATLERAARELEPLARGLAQVALGDSSTRAGSGDDPERGAREARAFLLGRLAQGTTLSRPWAAFGLALGERRRLRQGWNATPEVGAALRAALAAARSPEERNALALALGLIEDREARPAVLELFESPASDDVRGTFAVALGLLRSDEARGVLAATVRESRFRPGLLRDASVGLALIGDKEAVALLAGELPKAGSLASQAALCAALGTIGDARAVESLVAFLQDGENSARARAFAAAALGNVADPSPLPFHTPIARRVLWRSAPETLIDPAGGRGLLDIY